MRQRRMSLAEIAERNRARARDADLLASGWTPSPAQLADAPFIDAWEETTYPRTDLPALKGQVTGHPRLGSTYAWTSPIIARGDGWVRTESRFYRLGAPAPAREPQPPVVLGPVVHGPPVDPNDDPLAHLPRFDETDDLDRFPLGGPR